ncbi:MAG: GNAT family N-acetyltransferase [Bacteroidota bacterium]
MLEISFDPFPILKTQRLILRAPRLSDGPALFALRSDPEVMRYVDRPQMQTVHEAEQMLAGMQESIANNEGITWAITLPGLDELIGFIGYWQIEHEHYRAELGYMLHPSYQKQGYMSEALEAIIPVAFGPFRLHAIQAFVHPNNLPSWELLERKGFHREAEMKDRWYFQGAFWDTCMYTLLNPDSPWIRKEANPR